MASQNGKGDSPRPKYISDAEFEKRWNLAFGKNDKKKGDKNVRRKNGKGRKGNS